VISRHRLCKHVSAATDTHETIEVLLETSFLRRSLQRGYKEENWGNQFSFVRESVKKSVSWKGAAVRENLNPEAEEYPLLEAVTRQLLVKTLRCVKDLACDL
jgi:hypothetical protein